MLQLIQIQINILKAKRNQIVQRIKMLTQFYEENLVMRYQYPMMIITNTKKVFLKRLRRMKKMTAMQDSSQISSSKSQSSYVSINSSVFLKSVASHYSESDKQQNHDQKDQEDQYSEYQIYQTGEPLQSTLSSPSIKKTYIPQKQQPRKQQKQQDISHLICDFDNIDIDKAIKLYNKAMIQIDRLRKKQQQSADKKQKKLKSTSSSIVITPIQYNEAKNNKRGYQNKYVTKNPQFRKEYHEPRMNVDANKVSGFLKNSPTRLSFEESNIIKNKDMTTATISPRGLYNREGEKPTFKKQTYQDTIIQSKRLKALAVRQKAQALLANVKSQQNLRYNKYQ